MSRSTRPRTSLRLARSLAVINVLRWPQNLVDLDECTQVNARFWARRLGVRAAVLRRIILGRPVSLRAARRAERILEQSAAALRRRAATGRWT